MSTKSKSLINSACDPDRRIRPGRVSGSFVYPRRPLKRVRGGDGHDACRDSATSPNPIRSPLFAWFLFALRRVDAASTPAATLVAATTSRVRGTPGSMPRSGRAISSSSAASRLRWYRPSDAWPASRFFSGEPVNEASRSGFRGDGVGSVARARLVRQFRAKPISSCHPASDLNDNRENRTAALALDASDLVTWSSRAENALWALATSPGPCGRSWQTLQVRRAIHSGSLRGRCATLAGMRAGYAAASARENLAGFAADSAMVRDTRAPTSRRAAARSTTKPAASLAFVPVPRTAIPVGDHFAYLRRLHRLADAERGRGGLVRHAVTSDLRDRIGNPKAFAISTRRCRIGIGRGESGHPLKTRTRRIDGRRPGDSSTSTAAARETRQVLRGNSTVNT